MPNKKQSMKSDKGSVVAVADIKLPIGELEIAEADKIRKKYHEGKNQLDNRIVENEKWWKLQNYSQLVREKGASTTDPPSRSGYLFNCILGKHADAMDAYPTCNCLPREPNDAQEAKTLSSVLPVILEQNDFESTYSDEQWYKNKQGCGIFGIFWDKSKLNGLGDICIKKIDALALDWEPGIKDIQDSRHLFHTQLIDNDVLVEQYPELEGKLSTSFSEMKQYDSDDRIDNENKSEVVDWYYHKTVNGKKLLHYCKYVGRNVLFATENEIDRPKVPITDPNTGEQIGEQEVGLSLAERGWYDHGQYPFIFDSLFDIEESIFGMGYIDLAKDCQGDIDVLNQAIIKNTKMACKPRYFCRDEGSINQAVFADWNKDFIPCDSNFGEDSLRPVEVKSLDGNFITIYNNKIEELKQITSNRDTDNGGTTSGVTAASAIAAMQEASGRVSRDSNKASYAAYRKLCLMTIELVRQFYDVERQFRIVGSNGQEEFVAYSNKNIKPQPQGAIGGQDIGDRTPLFDIKVSAEKESPYKKMEQNELALQFFGLGFFNPQMTDQALSCLELMDFSTKDQIMQKIQQNGTLYTNLLQTQQMLITVAQMYDQATGNQLANQIAATISGQGLAPPAPSADSSELKADNKFSEEHPVVEKSREQAQSTSQVR